MKIFKSLAVNISTGVNWGQSVVTDTISDVATSASYIKTSIDEGLVNVGKTIVGSAKQAGNWAFNTIRTVSDNRETYKLRDDVVHPCENPLTQHPNPNDGRFMGAECRISDGDPECGRLPAGCSPDSGKPKIYYTNGVNTTENDLCKTLKALSESRCAEVVGIYNATYKSEMLTGKGYGLLSDGARAMDTIDEAGQSAAATRQSNLLVKNLTEGKGLPITIIAHSEGGLNTQSSLMETKAILNSKNRKKLREQGMSVGPLMYAEAEFQTEKMMRNINVISCGTAENGWIPGPSYTQYENTLDLIPKAIKLAQYARQKGTSKTPAVRFSEIRRGGGFMGHDMNEVYVKMIDEKNPVKKQANGKCC